MESAWNFIPTRSTCKLQLFWITVLAYLQFEIVRVDPGLIALICKLNLYLISILVKFQFLIICMLDLIVTIFFTNIVKIMKILSVQFIPEKSWKIMEFIYQIWVGTDEERTPSFESALILTFDPPIQRSKWLFDNHTNIGMYSISTCSSKVRFAWQNRSSYYQIIGEYFINL